MSKTDTLVVGGGVIGVCTAYFLAKRGCAVTVVDQGDIGGACSFGNAGLISVGHPPIPRPGLMWQAFKWTFDSTSPLYVAPRLDLSLMAWLWRFQSACRVEHFCRSMEMLAKLGHATMPLFDELIGGGSLACDYRKNGMMEVYRSGAGKRHVEADAELTRSLGFPAESLSEDELRQREPAIQGQAMGAVWYPGHATCNPHRFVIQLSERAADAGARLCPQTEVTGFVLSDGRVKGVRTQQGGQLEADNVVLAAGSWSTQLARMVGVSVPLQPAKGYHRDVEPNCPGPTHPCLFSEEKVVCTPMDDFLRLAGTLEFSGLNLDIRRQRLEMVTRAAAKYLPGIEQASTRSEWCGLRPCTADGLPVVGWAPRVGHLFIATGHAMLGLGLGPVTGKLACEAILDGRTSIDITSLRADRF